MMTTAGMADDMPSFEVLNNGGGMSLEDFSFIPSQEIERTNLINGDLVNGDLASCAEEISLEEAKKYIMELIEDNTTLKEKLKNDNVVMREQLSTVWEWHSQMTTSMAEQQLNLREAKQRIGQLEEENGRLAEAICEQNKEKVDDFSIINSPAQPSADTVPIATQTVDAARESKSTQNSLDNDADKQTALLREEHEKLKLQYTALQENYDRVTKLLQAKENKDNVKEDPLEQLASEAYVEKIDQVTAELLDAQIKLEEQNEKMQELARQVELLRRESEEIPILKAQVEVYKIDLNNAVLAKEAALDESDKLNQSLKDITSVSPFCENCGAVSVQDPTSPRGRGKKRVTRQPSPERFQCPVCALTFTDLQAVQNHVNRCLDQSA